jgi:hypothetical protein
MLICAWVTGTQWQNMEFLNFSLQLVRPYIFDVPDKIIPKSIKQGIDTLNKRIEISAILLAPHVNAFATGKPPKQIDGFAPTVANVSELLMAHFGWTGDSESTFKSKIWGHQARSSIRLFLFIFASAL